MTRVEDNANDMTNNTTMRRTTTMMTTDDDEMVDVVLQEKRSRRKNVGMVDTIIPTTVPRWRVDQ